MAKPPMIELTTTRKATAALAEPRPPYRLRITPTSKFGRTRYYLDNWLPMPAWARCFNSWTVRAAVGLAVAALAAGVAFGWWVLRLLGRTAR